MMSINYTVLCWWKQYDPVTSEFFAYYTRIASDFHILSCGSQQQYEGLCALRAEYPIVSVEHHEGATSSHAADYFNQCMLPSLVGRWIYAVASDEYVELPMPSVTQTVFELESSGVDVLPALVLNYSPALRWLTGFEPIDDEADIIKFPLLRAKAGAIVGASIPRQNAEEVGKIGLQAVVHRIPTNCSLADGDKQFPHNLVTRSSLLAHGLLRCSLGQPMITTIKA